MVAKTDQYQVPFLREKTQRQYPVIETRWIVAVYDVKEFRMYDGLGQCDINSLIPIPFQNSKREIEVSPKDSIMLSPPTCSGSYITEGTQ